MAHPEDASTQLSSHSLAVPPAASSAQGPGAVPPHHCRLRRTDAGLTLRKTRSREWAKSMPTRRH